MGKVSGNAGCVDDIVEGELVHEGGKLQEQGQRLAERWRSAGAPVKVLRFFFSPRVLTCPIPPEAPATTIFIVHVSPNGLHPRVVCDCVVVAYRP